MNIRSALAVVLVVVISYSNDTLHLVVPDFKPYTYEHNDSIQGAGVERVSDILKSLGIPFSLSLVPNYGRAVAETRNGRCDGFFLATQNSERDSIAHFSGPLMINRWCWFTLRDAPLQVGDSTFKLTARVATPINSNTHKWLKYENYNVAYPVTDVSVLVTLLLDGLVDVVFVSEEVFLHQLNQQKIPLSSIERYIESERPFGLYLSNETVKNNPDVIESIIQMADLLPFEEREF